MIVSAELLKVWREECRKSDHLFDAVICAYTGYLWSRDDWQLPADTVPSLLRDGWIWVPPERPGEQAAAPVEEPTDEPRRRTLP